jgi:hypothetical protein
MHIYTVDKISKETVKEDQNDLKNKNNGNKNNK